MKLFTTFPNFIKKYPKLTFITFIGFILRILNPTFGSPVLYVIPDEVSNYVSALYMIANKTLISTASQYTPLGSYIQIPFLILAFVIMRITGNISSVADFEFSLATHEGYFLFIPRILSAIFGSLTIPIVYFLSLELSSQNKRVSLISSALFAFSLTHIQLSHQGRPWAPSLFFLILAMFYLVKACSSKYANKRGKFIIISAIFIAITIGFFLQVGIIGLFLFLIFQFLPLSYRRIGLNELKKSLFGIVIISSSIILFNQLTLFKPTIDFLFAVKPDQLSLLNNSAFGFFIKQLFTSEPLIAFFALIFLFKKNAWKQPFLALSVFVLGYIFSAGFLFWQASRYLLPILTILSIYAGIEINLLINKISSKPLRFAFSAILIAVFLFLPLLWHIRFLQKPTFIQAKEWIEENIDPETRIASTSVRYSSFVPSLDAIKIMQEKKSNAYQRAKKFIIRDYYPDNVRNIIYLEKITQPNNQKEVIELIKQYHFSYFIDYYWDPKKRFANILPGDEFQLIKKFSPSDDETKLEKVSNLYATMDNPDAFSLLLNIKRAGPYVEVIKY